MQLSIPRIARRTLISVFLLLILSAVLYVRYRIVVCKHRGEALLARLDNLRHDAVEQLLIGAKKEVLVRFCKQHGLALTVTSDKAYGKFSAIGQLSR